MCSAHRVYTVFHWGNLFDVFTVTVEILLQNKIGILLIVVFDFFGHP